MSDARATASDAGTEEPDVVASSKKDASSADAAAEDLASTGIFEAFKKRVRSASKQSGSSRPKDDADSADSGNEDGDKPSAQKVSMNGGRRR